MTFSGLASQPLLYTFVPIDPDTPRIRVNWVRQNGFLAQHSARVHGHYFSEIIYCEGGGGVHRVGEQQWDTQPGDLFFIAPGEIHDAGNLRSQRWVLQFTQDAIAPLIFKSFDNSWYCHPLSNLSGNTRMHSHYFHLTSEVRSPLTQHLQGLEIELSRKQSGYKEAARAHLTLILVELARLLTAENPVNAAQNPPLLTEVFQMIEAHYAEPISLIDIARLVERSPAYLTTFVRRLTGRTVLEWITERRMAEACHLLLTTDKNLTKICQQVGYRDPNSFIRLFRQLYNITPGEWRRINRS
jgi:AraC-like DNA-binding protein